MTHLSTLDLHQLRYGELPRPRDTAARAHLDACDRCRARYQAQVAARAAFELQPVPPALRTPAPRPGLARWLGLPAFAALAVATLLAVGARPDPSGGPIAEITRAKGEPVVVVAQGRGALTRDARVLAGDRLQVEISPGPWGEAWVADRAEILGRFPVRADGPTLSPFSLTLDAAPGAEHLVVVLAPAGTPEAQVTRALAGDPQPGLKKIEYTFVKGP